MLKDLQRPQPFNVKFICNSCYILDMVPVESSEIKGHTTFFMVLRAFITSGVKFIFL